MEKEDERAALLTLIFFFNRQVLRVFNFIAEILVFVVLINTFINFPEKNIFL